HDGAERLVPLPSCAVYSSPVGRAMQTEEVISTKACLDVIAEPRLQEYDFGEAVSGLTWQEIREQQPEIIEAFRSGRSDFPAYPGEEGRAPFQERVRAAMRDISERHYVSYTVAVLTHAGPITS